jgi:hypothetical protein
MQKLIADTAGEISTGREIPDYPATGITFINGIRTPYLL